MKKSFFVPMSLESLNFRFHEFWGKFFKNHRFRRNSSIFRRDSESGRKIDTKSDT